MVAKYCNADCQKNHWSTHKKECKLRAAELRDEALFKEPPPKEDCSICFLPMPEKLVCCKSLPPATKLSVPVYDYAMANEELALIGTEVYYECCGKSICQGCIYSFVESGNSKKCPFCNSDQGTKTDEEKIEQLMKRVEANDAGANYALGSHYYHGLMGLRQDQEKAKELWIQAAQLGSSQAHFCLGIDYRHGGDLKKAKFHYEAAAMAGHEVARNKLGLMEGASGNIEGGVKHWTIAASAGDDDAMHNLLLAFNHGQVSRDTIDSTLTAYNTSCAEMRSKARDACT
jgi:TPR repeat protein